MAKPCQECNKPIEFKKDLGRWIPIDANGGEHWLTCSSEFATHKRTRLGLEPGIFPMSPSRINLYRSCPQAYRDRYVSEPRVPEDLNGQMRLRGRLGNSIHVRQAAILNHEEIPPPDVPLEFHADWKYLCEVVDRLEWDMANASTEETLTHRWQDGAMTVEFECRVDFLQIEDVRAVETDWKSGWAIKSEAQLKKDVQANTNALCLMKAFPQLEAVRFQQVHLRHGGRVVGVWFGPDDLVEYEELLHAEVGRILRDVEFKPNPYCTVCPPGAHPRLSYPIDQGDDGKVRIAEPTSYEEAAKLAAFAFQQQQIYSAAMAALNPWCDINGPIGGLGHHEVESKRCTNIAEFIHLVETSEGYMGPIEEYVQPVGKKLVSILKTKRQRELALDVLPLLTTTPGTKFEWRKEDGETGGAVAS